MIKDDGVYFSEGCPQAGSYTKPVTAEQFTIDSSALDKYVEVTAFFVDDPTGFTAAPETQESVAVSAELSRGSMEVRRAQQVVESDEKLEAIGSALVKNIAVCPGRMLTADGPACPAFNWPVICSLINEQ